MSNQATKPQKVSGFIRFINGVERVGNKLPHPFFLFCGLAVIALLLSVLLAGTSVTYEVAKDGVIENTTVSVVNLMNKAYWQNITQNIVKIYINFAPLGIVMVMMFAIGFAQDSGFFEALMKKSLLSAPPVLVTYVLAVICVCANMASNAGIIFCVTVGAAIFSSLGRNPLIGAVFGYCGAHGGFTANLMISADDVLQCGITQSAADGMGITGVPINPMMNYYFLVLATFVLAAAATFVTERVMPKVCKYEGIHQEMTTKVTPEENRGLRNAGITFIVFLAIMLFLTVPKNAFFRNDDGTLVPQSPFTNSVVFILLVMFIALGTAYGLGAGTIKKQADFPRLMGKGLSDSISFFVIAFPSALFIQFFNDSKLATILAVNGSNLLKSWNFTGIPLILSFLVLVTMLNMCMTSGSSKWLIFAPIFVPMFYSIGLSPAFTQLCYRVGDTMTNPIAPINYYLPIVLGVMSQYKKPEDPEFGMGTLISMNLPYSISYVIVLVPMLIIWYLLNLPIGPGATIFVPGM